MPYDTIKKQDPEAFSFLAWEEDRQRYELELIASENYVSQAVLEANGSILTNKYSEWYPGKRYYAGQEFIDKVENLAIERAKKLFGAEYVNVQPLSGSPANLAVFLAVLSPGDTILWLSLDQWGHLTHGHPLNFSGKTYNIVPYLLDKTTERIDMDEVERLAREHKPKLILAGFSAYSRSLDWARFRAIADEVGAILMADIAHIAWLVAGWVLENPVPYCDIVTTTTHKTLRGPRGAIIMSKEKYGPDIARAVFPGVQWGPHDHTNLAKAIAFWEALESDFKVYARQVIDNAIAMSDKFMENGIRVVSWGTENHIILLDVFGSVGLSGKEAEHILETVGISCNKNMIPYDPRKPMDPSGIRLGTPAITTRGMKQDAVLQVADIIIRALRNPKDEAFLSSLKKEVRTLCEAYPIP
jgi:glycine hydroxymethyltransferase